MLSKSEFGLGLVCLIVAAVGCGSSDSETATPATVADLVINEISATGTVEWAEIGNRASGSVDIGGYGISDTDKTTGQPKTNSALRFPTGTTIAAGEYIVVLFDQTDSSGPYNADRCLSGSSVTCYHATFGLSAKDGESLHLLASDNRIISTVAYPKDLTPVSTANQTVCRIPNMTGEFEVCTASPGAANAK